MKTTCVPIKTLHSALTELSPCKSRVLRLRSHLPKSYGQPHGRTRSATAIAIAALQLFLSAANAQPEVHQTAQAALPKPQQPVITDATPKGLSAPDWKSIREEYERNRHAVSPVDGGFRASNPGQQWQTRFDGRGFTTEPKSGNWQWGLELRSYGFPGQERAVIDQRPSVQAQGGRVTYDWDGTLQEWFINDTGGLEHGFTIKDRPAGASALNSQTSALNFLLAVRGSLRPVVQADGTGVCFVDARGSTALTYDGLVVSDADGRKLPSRFETTADPKLLRLSIDEKDASYPLTVDPYARQAYLKASNTGAGDYFGQSVAISGDTVVVGAIFEDSSATGVNGNQGDNTAPNSGAAYVFVRLGRTWTQQAYLKASNTESDDYFGWSVAISSNTIVVGARLEDSGASGINGNQADNSTHWAGAAYVFVRNGTSWSQQAYLKAANPGVDDRFGHSVSVSGDTIVVGALYEDSSATGVDGDSSNNSAVDSGAAYVFVRNGTTWSQQAYLKASNTDANDAFGYSVAVFGDTAVVGAVSESSNAIGVNGNQSDNSAAGSGAAYVFVRDGSAWSQHAYLKTSNPESGDAFGVAVAVSGDSILVGAYGEDSSAGGVNGNQTDNNTSQSGAAYIFVRDGTNWSQQAYLKAPSPSVGSYFGYAVGISDNTAVIGAPYNFSLSGSAYIYIRNGATWTYEAGYYDGNINPVETDLFGYSVAVSGNTVVVGQPLEDSNATGVNGNGFNSSLADSGAAFVYSIPSTQLLALVDIDATSLPPGLLASITNRGAMGGFFEARGGGATVPSIAAVDGGGTIGIRFDGDDYLQHVSTVGGPVLSSPLVGVSSPCTIEAWVLNGAIDREETIVSWGRRGGSPDGSNLGFNYGWDAAWGAVGHWGSTDIGWTSGTDGGGVYGAGVPSAGAWHHLVYTWDGSSTQRVYADGVQKNSETVSLQIASGPSFILAAQTDSDGSTVATGNRGSLTIGRLRIHDGAMTAAQVATNYLAEVGVFTNGPGTQLATGPTHRYQFNNTAGAAPAGSAILDSLGAANGTVLGSGGTFTGNRLTLPGGTSGTYVDLPDGLLSANSTNNGGTGEVTLEGWLRMTGSQNWSRILDFGSSSGGVSRDSLYYTAQNGTDVRTRRLGVDNADAVGGTGGGGFLDHGTTTYGQDLHFAITWNDATGEIRIFENGSFVARRTETARLRQINDVNVWLGRSQYTSDPNLQGQFDEFRIYNRVLSDAELRGTFLRGPDNLTGWLKIFNVTGGGADCGSVPVGLSGSETGVTYLLFTNSVYAQIAVEGTGGPINFGAQMVNATYSVLGSNTTLAVTEPMGGSAAVVVVQPPAVGGGSPTCVSTPSNLVAFWRAENNATDSVGTNNGTLNGAVTFNSCAVGGAGFNFTTLGSYVSVPFSPDLQQTNLTVEGWVLAQGTPTTQAGILGTWNDLGGAGTAWRRTFMMWSYQGKLEFLCGVGSTIDRATDPAALPINAWVHVAGTYDGSTIRLYRNGTQVASKAYSGILNTNDQRFYIGRTDAGGDGSDYWRGMIDDVSVYSRALSSNEIAAIYAAGSAGKCLTTGNSSPFVANLIPDTNGIYGTPFNFAFAANTFSDPDTGQTLSYSASGLPSGISFTPATRTFSGTPTNVGTFSVTVTATDNGSPGLSTNDVFDIVIAQAPLTVTAYDTNRFYGQPNPDFSGVVLGLVLGDNITAMFATTATIDSPPGTYPIAPVLSDPDGRLVNYTLTANNGTLTINAVAELQVELPLGTVLATNTAIYFGSMMSRYLDPTTQTHEPDNTYTVTFTGIFPSPYAAYQIQFASNPFGPWSQLPAPGLAPDAGGTIQFHDPTPRVVAYYRLLILTDTQRIFTIRNTGSNDLSGIAVTVGGTNVANFELNLTGTATLLSPGASTTFAVTYVAGDTNARAAELIITGNLPSAFVLSLIGGDVSPPNHAPEVANPIPDTNGVYGSPMSFTFVANTFSDPDAGQSLTYSASGLPPEITFTPATRTFSGTPTAVGTNSVTVTATDNGSPALSTNDVFDIIIAKAPLVVTANDTNRVYGTANPTLTGSLVGLVNNDNITATFSTTATIIDPPGTYPILPQLNDPDGRLINYLTTTNTATLTITSPPQLSFTLGGGGGGGLFSLSWPASYSGFVLEYTENLAPPVDWHEVTSGITETGGLKSYVVTSEPGVPGRLYRLRLP